MFSFTVRRAFTIIEILIVIVILVILAAIVLPGISNPPNSTNSRSATLGSPTGATQTIDIGNILEAQVASKEGVTGRLKLGFYWVEDIRDINGRSGYVVDLREGPNVQNHFNEKDLAEELKWVNIIIHKPGDPDFENAKKEADKRK